MSTRTRMLSLVALAALSVGAVACGADDDDDSSGATANDGASQELAEAKPGAPQSAATAAASSDFSYGGATARDEDGGGTSTDQSIERKIIYNTALDIDVPSVEPAFYEVQRLARNAQGFVESSNLSVRSDDNGSPQFASVTLRVPVSTYDGLLDSLRRLEGAKVSREESQSTEVTEEYTDLQARVRNLQQTEAQYLRLLEQATTIPDILSVNERIDSVRLQIEQAQGRINLLDNLADLATVDVQLSAIAPARAEEPKPEGGIPTFAEAFEGSLAFSAGALRVLAAAGAIGAVAAAWLIPVAAIALIGRRVARSRRTSAASPTS